MPDDDPKPAGGGSNEMFYLDENGVKQDAALHDEILAGDHEAAIEVSRKIMRDLGLDPSVLLPTPEQKRKKAWARLKAHSEAVLKGQYIQLPSGKLDGSLPGPGHGEGGGGDGGGGKGGHKEGPTATELLAESTPTPPTMDDLYARLSPRDKDEIKSITAELETLPKTTDTVEQGGFRISKEAFPGVFTPEREELHSDIASGYFTPEAVADATPKPGEKPSLLLLGGRAGSGKSSSLTPEEKTGRIVINVDDIQEKLPGYHPRLAAIYNDEAQSIAMRMEKVTRAMGLNVMIDGTMRTKERTLSIIDRYKKEGYEIDAKFVSTSPLESATRAVSRWRDGKGKGTYQDRYVTPTFPLEALTNEDTFDSIKSELRKWSLYDNNGPKIKLVASGGRKKK